jgi:PAS domain S-box-containing protein
MLSESESDSESTEIMLSSNHQNLFVVEERDAEAISPKANARTDLSTPTAPLTPIAREGSRAAAIIFEIKTVVVAKTTISTVVGSGSSSQANLGGKSQETKDEDLPNFQVLFESTLDPQLILKSDSRFTIVAVNEAYLKATMTKRELILKKGLFEVFPDNPSDPKADGARNLRDSLQRVIKNSVADTMPIQKYDVRCPEAQGSEFEERYWSPINMPVLGQTGKVDFIIHRVEDVTHLIHLKQQETEQQIRAEALKARTEQMETELCNNSRDIQKKEEAFSISHKRYSTLTSILPVGIFHTDLQGHCLYVNSYWQTITGIKEEESKDQHWLTLLQLADPDPVLTAWQQCQETGSCQIEFRFFGADHKNYWVFAQMTSEQVGNEITGYVGSLTNITELKELEQTRIMAIQQTEKHQRKLAEAAEKHRRNQEQFIDTMCHELRNPLNGIYGNVDFLQSSTSAMERMIREASPQALENTFQTKILRQLEDHKESLKVIEACARYQKIIADDVLNLSKLEAGKVELNLIDFDLIQLVRGAVRMLETQANQKQICLNLKLPSSCLRVKGDPNRLTQVLLNLVSNALKFTLEKGDVIVSLLVLEETPAYTEFQFRVKDTGIGMSEAEQNKLFDRFVQASPKISMDYGGSGLGLVISKKLIELMEGKIEVKSKKWKGTQFSFTIKLAPAPLLEEDEKPTPIHPVTSKKLNSLAGRPLHILIAEDNLINQKILVKQLKQAGHICYVANNGQEACEIHGKTPLDLIFMDIEMPVKNGFEATQAIRQKEQAFLRPPIPIIGLSGNARLEHKEEALSMGMDDYITKPYDREKLLETIAYYAPLISPRAVTEGFTPKTITSLSSSSITPLPSPLRPRGLNSSLTTFFPPAKEKQESVLEDVKAKKKKESTERTSFWNSRKLALAVAIGGAIKIGVTLAARSD